MAPPSDEPIAGEQEGGGMREGEEADICRHTVLPIQGPTQRSRACAPTRLSLRSSSCTSATIMVQDYLSPAKMSETTAFSEVQAVPTGMSWCYLSECDVRH